MDHPLTIGPAASHSADQSAEAKVFQKRLYDAIGVEWRQRLKAHANELAVGVVHVDLTLTRSGKISDLRVMSNTSSDQRLAELSLDSIKHAKIPAPPQNLLKRGEFKIGLTFNVYPNST